MGQVPALGTVRIRAFTDQQRLDVLQRLAQLVRRERTNDIGADQTRLDALGPQRVGGILGGFPGGVQQEQRHFSIVHPVQVQHLMFTPRQGGIFPRNLRIDLARFIQRQRQLIVVIQQVIAAHMRTYGHRMGRIGHIRIIMIRVRAHEILYRLVLLEVLDLAFLVGGEEAVIGDDNRQAYLRMFGNSESHDVHIIYSLGVLAVRITQPVFRP